MATKSSITKELFDANAKDLILEVRTADGKVLFQTVASHRMFHSGALGWYANGKFPVIVGSDVGNVQFGANMTIVGTKAEERPNLNDVRKANGKPPIELDQTGFAPAKATPPLIKKGSK